MSAIPLCRVSGRFYRAVLADRAEHVLDPSGPDSAGRYHRPGQSAIYITPEADWAAIVTGSYAAEDGLARSIVPLELDEAHVLDQRDESICAKLGIDRSMSIARWRPALAEGREPLSWQCADVARAMGADGLIDPSRGIVGGWHAALFRWNVPGAPQLRVAGDPLPCNYETSRARWASPEGWELGAFEKGHR